MSSESSISSESTQRQDGHIECYKVLYSPGEMSKPGTRSWHEGLITYYTSNRKLILRDRKALILQECYNVSPPAFPSSEAGQALQPIKEEGKHPASFPIGVAFQLSSTYTIEIEKVKYIHEKIVDVTALQTRQDSLIKRKDKIQKAFRKNIPDILDDKYDYSEDPTAPGKKRKAPLHTQDGNTTPTSGQSADTTKGSPSKKAPWDVINATPNRGRVSGLSKAAKRS